MNSLVKWLMQDDVPDLKSDDVVEAATAQRLAGIVVDAVKTAADTQAVILQKDSPSVADDTVTVSVVIAAPSVIDLSKFTQHLQSSIPPLKFRTASGRLIPAALQTAVPSVTVSVTFVRMLEKANAKRKVSDMDSNVRSYQFSLKDSMARHDSPVLKLIATILHKNGIAEHDAEYTSLRRTLVDGYNTACVAPIVKDNVDAEDLRIKCAKFALSSPENAQALAEDESYFGVAIMHTVGRDDKNGMFFIETQHLSSQIDISLELDLWRTLWTHGRALYDCSAHSLRIFMWKRPRDSSPTIQQIKAV